MTNCTEQWELRSLFQKWHLTHVTSTSVVDQATKVTFDHLMTSLSQKTLHKPHWLKLITNFPGNSMPCERWLKSPIQLWVEQSTVHPTKFEVHEKCENWIFSLSKHNVQFVNSSEAVLQPTKLLSDSPRGGIQSPVCSYFDPHHFYLWETMNDGVYVRTHILCKNIWRAIFNISRQKLCHTWRRTSRMCQGCMEAEQQGKNSYIPAKSNVRMW